jgi:hypothetical protein
VRRVTGIPRLTVGKSLLLPHFDVGTSRCEDGIVEIVRRTLSVLSRPVVSDFGKLSLGLGGTPKRFLHPDLRFDERFLCVDVVAVLSRTLASSVQSVFSLHDISESPFGISVGPLQITLCLGKLLSEGRTVTKLVQFLRAVSKIVFGIGNFTTSISQSKLGV